MNDDRMSHLCATWRAARVHARRPSDHSCQPAAASSALRVRKKYTRTHTASCVCVCVCVCVISMLPSMVHLDTSGHIKHYKVK
jgi:hypothetical protein